MSVTKPANLNSRKFALGIGAFFLIFLATLAIAPLIGPTSIDLAKAFSGGWSSKDNIDADILFLARIPRILLGALTGAALSVTGAVFQALLRNDLAAPFTLGVSSGASFGAVIAISLGLNYTLFGISTLSIAAFLGALGTMLLVFGLVKTRHGDFPTPVLLLAGVTANFFFASMVMFIHYLADFTQSFQIVRWLMGGLDITDYQTLGSIFPMVALGIGGLIYFSRDLNLISAGIQSASSRGVDVLRTQKASFILASLITGTVVAISGPIGFVGLIVPHMVRLMVGPDLRLLIPGSMFFGASFLILCDTVGRTLIAPAEIPVGVITAMLGGPFFVWLLKCQQKKGAI
ncbi:MAG: iron chelate uptake ABC transporter family permease subunit [Nitrospinaceae bacterium]|nr:iron ABC transporter permease [Nitrospinaceae bacterium]NIR55834.1 iron ABC transporter permease [Nitrospinaceae bacterium]NIS86287.1 iron ABC transporter permease [Nitrospinaceae bacterium]NIT83116.1 iron ABC transporter permease [Nitrospinaceae bacterium]NIU45326.1 iron ABC transporter permease [Nitrospinaceae bacterium]